MKSYVIFTVPGAKFKFTADYYVRNTNTERNLVLFKGNTIVAIFELDQVVCIYDSEFEH